MPVDVEDRRENELNDIFTIILHICVLLSYSYLKPSYRATLNRRKRRKFWQTTEVLSDEEFRICFRMNRREFKNLVDLVRVHLTRDDKMSSLRNGVIEPEVRVAIVVRIMSGASSLDLVLIWHVARSTIFQIFHDTSSILVENLTFDGFPSSPSECERLANGFSVSRAVINPLYGCVGCLDGIAIRIRKPRKQDCLNPAHYYHRKGFYAIPVQAICDSNYRFLFFSAKCAGPTHDSVAFSVSSYDNLLRNGELPPNYWIAADDAYVCNENIISPFSSSEAIAGSHHDAFNFYLSSHRMHIEQSFGILMSRWGILWKPLQFKLSENIRSVQLAMLLHNFCIENNDDSVIDLVNEEEFQEIMHFNKSLSSTLSQGFDESSSLPGRRKKSIRSSQREILLRVVQELEYTRPKSTPQKRQRTQ